MTKKKKKRIEIYLQLMYNATSLTSADNQWENYGTCDISLLNLRKHFPIESNFKLA